MKNYIVKFKNVKGKNGLSKMVNYLFSENHSSHSKTKIINVGRTTKKDFISSVIEKENSNSLKVQQQRKGGRPSSFYGKSITLNFPPTVWADILKNPIIINDILKEVYKDISKYLNVEEDIFLNNVLSVLHLQKNPHIHFIIP
ncbi:MAG: hypothetical protein U9N59_10355, partial [Campylobacterota bacterium]|nr:hypothetical protein [Campylobacterota bacterium]